VIVLGKYRSDLRKVEPIEDTKEKIGVR